MCLSGWFCSPPPLSFDHLNASRVFVYNGMADDVVDYKVAANSYHLLNTLGATSLELHSEKGLYHSLSSKELRLMKEFYSQVC